MKVESILKRKGRQVNTIDPDSLVMVAIHRLVAENIGALVVSRDGERVDGVLSERDIVRGLMRHGGRLLEMNVGSVMSKGVPVCSPEDTLATVMTQMTLTRNRHLPVVDGGRLCGIVSIGDVVKDRVEELQLEASVLRDAYLTRS